MLHYVNSVGSTPLTTLEPKTGISDIGMSGNYTKTSNPHEQTTPTPPTNHSITPKCRENDINQRICICIAATPLNSKIGTYPIRTYTHFIVLHWQYV